MNFKSQISFLYYKNLQDAVAFYEKIFGFELAFDQGWAKIYKIVDGAYLGLVDQEKGFFNWQNDKTIMITLVTENPESVDKWYENLKKNQVKILTEPKDIKEIGIRAFLFEDPEGYVIEIQYFYDEKN